MAFWSTLHAWSSLYPTFSSEMNLHDCDWTNASLLTASSSNEVRSSIAITWKEIVEETLNDKLFSKVFICIKKGQSLKNDESLSVFYRYNGALYISS